MERFHHVSVLLAGVLEGLKIRPDGIYVDATLGGAGHGKAILDRLGPQGMLVGIDQDPAALLAAKERLSGRSDQVKLLKGNFSEMKDLLVDAGIQKVDGILFDLGVSSHQLDTPERGFSYQQQGPLDMRMNPLQHLTADEIIHNWSEEEISKILFEYGEEKFSRRIAKQIIKHRTEKRIEDTLELSEIIKNAIPAATRRTGHHPAKRSFQGLRIAVNRELEILEQAFKDGVELLNPEGRICVITFHSLEDRITKKVFRELENPCKCPPSFPMCVCGKTPSIKTIGKAQGPTEKELEVNPRARSAKLRIAEKIE